MVDALEYFDNIFNQYQDFTAKEEVFNSLDEHKESKAVYAEFFSGNRELLPCFESILSAHLLLVKGFEGKGKLMLCGNGGSFADCMHISSEFLKSFERKRTLSHELQENLIKGLFSEELIENLEGGLPAVVLGNNASFASAVMNDNPKKTSLFIFAQECLSLARADDFLWGISTSGNSENILMAFSLAKALSMPVLALSGRDGGRMAEVADVTIVAPGESTPKIQENHIKIYHTLCAGVEAHFYPTLR
jgi:D-sedoheptulose 7-phosphate isomerase